MPRASVESVVDYDVDDRTVSLSCRVTVDDGEPAPDDTVTLPDRTDPVTIEFLAPTVFRFVFDAVPENGPPSTTLSLDTESVTEPVDLSVTERDDQLRIESDGLTVEIGLSNWSFTVRDARGRRLLAEQQRDVTAKGESRVDPLGYTVERTNRWPLSVTETGSAFVLGGDEHVYGFGEQFTEFDVRGRTVDAWVTQPNGAETGHAYKNVPFYLSSAGYGLLVDTTAKTTFDVGNSSVVSHQIAVAADTFSFVFIGDDDFETILERYTGLTGRSPRLPRWSYGVWMSRATYESQSEVTAVADRLREEGMPCDVLHLDPGWLDGLCSFRWDRDAYPDPEEMIASLHDRGFHVCLWEYPYLLSRTEAFEEARDHGYLVEDGTGAPYILDRLSWSSDRGGIVDFTDPAARAWWRRCHESLLEMGVDAFKVDFGEYLPEDAVLSDGRSGRAVRNIYPNLYAETVRSAIAEYREDEPPVLWTRSGWAGGQRFPVHWGGDPAATFESMAASFRGGLSLGLSGYAHWSVDVGGFHGTPSTTLYVRWAQASLLGTSHVRFHGTTPREPWAFGDDALDIVRRYARERYRLLPYLETLGEIAHQRGLPVMRPLVLAFQDDHGARTCGDQVMLGPAILVAPVFRADGDRAVYLPPGEWVDYWHHDRLSGGRTVHRSCSLDELPVYLRAGTVHPVTTEVGDYVDPEPPAVVTVRMVLADGSAAGAVLDYTTDRLVTVTADTDDGTLFIEASFEHAVVYELLAIETVPESIVVEDQTLTRVETAPEPGEWTVEDEDRIRVQPPE